MTAITFPTMAERCSQSLEVPPAFSVPDVSNRLLWRLARLYRDIVFLTRCEGNDQGGAYAGNAWYLRKYKCSNATLRLWRKILAEHGWIEAVRKTKRPLFVPLVSPETVLSFLPRFKRLFRGVFSGKTDGLPYSPDREINSNSHAAPAAPARGKAAKPPLAPADAAVAVKAANAGVSADYAEELVRRCGAGAVLDALEALWSARRRGKDIVSPGGWVRALAEKLAAGAWNLPASVIRERAAAERKAEREKAAAARVVTAAPRVVTAGAAAVSTGEKPPVTDDTPQNAPDPGHGSAVTVDPLLCLPEAQRHALLAQALEQVLAETIPALRGSIERLGTGHRAVQARARLLLQEGGA